MSDVTRRGLLAACGASALLLATSRRTLSAARACGPRTGKRLEIVGNTFHADGAKLRLLGVGVGDPIHVRHNRGPGDYAVIANSWHANTVRISLLPGDWRADRARAFELLKADVAAARAAGLWVIVVWHVIGFPGRYFEHPGPDWGLPNDIFVSDEALALDFWDEAARAFAEDPGVILELWNEPVGDGKLWHSTGEHWPLLKATWLRLLATIRRHSDAVVLAAGGCWAHDLVGVADDLIDDDRVAYAWHTYPPWDGGKPSGWLQSLGGLEAVKPIVVSEWGFSRDGEKAIKGTPESFGRPFVEEILEPLALSSTAWCWSESASPQMLEANGSPTEFGRFVKDYLRSVAGSTCAASLLGTDRAVPVRWSGGAP